MVPKFSVFTRFSLRFISFHRNFFFLTSFFLQFDLSPHCLSLNISPPFSLLYLPVPSPLLPSTVSSLPPSPRSQLSFNLPSSPSSFLPPLPPFNSLLSANQPSTHFARSKEEILSHFSSGTLSVSRVLITGSFDVGSKAASHQCNNTIGSAAAPPANHPTASLTRPHAPLGDSLLRNTSNEESYTRMCWCGGV